MNGSQFADETCKKLRKITINSINKKKYEKTLESLSALAKLKYTYNQEYKDEWIEDSLVNLSFYLGKDIDHQKNDKNVLFYDGFGTDYRGLAQIYLKALAINGYHIIYVSNALNESQQPIISEILDNTSHITYNYSKQNFVNKIKWLDDIYFKENFSTAFFYTTPWDVAGIISFNKLKNKCVRYQINLTDHAFWLGINAFDYCLEFRNYGAAISRDFRGVDEKKLLLLPYYPIINKNIDFLGFPFDIKNKKIVFSGGSNYKTISKDNLFYKMIEHIVANHKDTIFVYASNGLNLKLSELTNKYPNQVYHIAERSDLFKILENSYLYLNTYPISGGLMIQFAAVARCVPVTLKRPWDDDAIGLLKNEDTLDEIFTDYNLACQELDKLLTNNKYREEKQRLLVNQVITEEEFTKTLKNIIDDPSSAKMSSICSVNTESFRNSYAENITERDVIENIILKEYKSIFINLPTYCIKRLYYKVKKEIGRITSKKIGNN